MDSAHSKLLPRDAGFPSDSEAEDFSLPRHHSAVAQSRRAALAGDSSVLRSPVAMVLVSMVLVVGLAFVILNAEVPVVDTPDAEGTAATPDPAGAPGGGHESGRVERPAIDCPLKKNKCGPSVFVAGAQKSGTSSLFEFLCQHPDFVPPLFGTHAPGENPKEIAFYDHENNFIKGFDWYLTQYPNQKTRITGDGTPDYVWYPSAFERMAADWPDAKIVLSLRDPVTRTFSNYKMAVFFYENQVIPIAKPGTFQEEINKDLQGMKMFRHVEFNSHTVINDFWDSKLTSGPLDQDRLMVGNRQIYYIERSLYAEQLRRVYQYYPKEQVKIIQFEKLVDPAHTERILREVCEFLNLDPSLVELKLPHVLDINEALDVPPMTEQERQALVSFYRSHNEDLFQLLGERFDWQDA